MIDEVTIDSDESGFTLELVGDFTEAVAAYENDQGCRLRLRLPQDAAIQLLAQTQLEIGPWVAEMQDAFRDYQALRAVAGERESLDPDDPKHPDYRDRLADIGDARRKREREAS